LGFARKQRFKLKKIKRPIYVRNIDSFFNKKGPIKHMIEGDLVLKEGKVYMLKNEALRVKIIQLHYDILVADYREK